MTASTTLVSLLAAALAAPAFAQAPAASPLTRIGAAAAVAGRVLAVAPNAAVGRVVSSGKPIFLNDHVTTGAQGRLQVLLLDQTVFTLGPDSDMVLDEFVYDPNTNAGRLAATVEKGAFRFISGHISHDSGANMKVRTPSGTMGIRGTIVVGQVSGQASTLILAGPGAENNAGETPGMIDVSNGAGSVTIDQPGYGTTLSGNLPPTPPAPMTRQLLTITEQVGVPPASQASRGGGQQTSQGGRSNATSEAGQDTASSREDADVTSEVQTSNGDAAAVTDVANQDLEGVGGLADGVSTWEQIADAFLSGVLVGQDQYSMSGAYACTGGTCGAGVGGNTSATLTVDWSARAIGGSGSSVTLAAATSQAGSFSGDTVSVPAASFPATSGPAYISISGFTPTPYGTMQTLTVVLENHGGVVAKHADADFTYTGSSSESISGGVSGDRP